MPADAGALHVSCRLQYSVPLTNDDLFHSHCQCPSSQRLIISCHSCLCSLPAGIQPSLSSSLIQVTTQMEWWCVRPPGNPAMASPRPLSIAFRVLNYRCLPSIASRSSLLCTQRVDPPLCFHACESASILECLSTCFLC